MIYFTASQIKRLKIAPTAAQGQSLENLRKLAVAFDSKISEPRAFTDRDEQAGPLLARPTLIADVVGITGYIVDQVYGLELGA